MAAYSGYTDQELVVFLRQGEDRAFMEIYERYQALLFAYAYRKLQDKEEAQDVVQEIFITLWEKRDNFVLKTHLSGFLYKSVLNRVLDIWKHQRVVQQHVEAHQLTIDVDSVETDYLVREKDILALIEKEIAAMPPRMREVYHLKHREYLSTKAIATQLGISENTVSNQLKNASAHLKQRLGLVVFVLYVLN